MQTEKSQHLNSEAIVDAKVNMTPGQTASQKLGTHISCHAKASIAIGFTELVSGQSELWRFGI